MIPRWQELLTDFPCLVCPCLSLSLPFSHIFRRLRISFSLEFCVIPLYSLSHCLSLSSVRLTPQGWPGLTYFQPGGNVLQIRSPGSCPSWKYIRITLTRWEIPSLGYTCCWKWALLGNFSNNSPPSSWLRVILLSEELIKKLFLFD